MAEKLDLSLEIKAATDGAVKAIGEVTKELNSLESQVENSLKDPFKNFQKSAQKLGRNLQSVGKTLSTFVTGPLVGLGALAVKNFQVQEQALAQVRQGLISTGQAAGRSLDQLTKQAAELQKNSLFGDEQILQGVTSQLITFTNIAGKQFDRTQQAALDLAARLGGDLQGASIQLGKALNDPVANLSALSRSGIQFSKAQKELINSLVETNQLAKAQDIILDELNKQYGGSAKAAADASIGIVQLKNEFGDFLETIGELAAPFFRFIIDQLRSFVAVLNNLSPSVKLATVAVLAFVAALGPLLIALGTLISILSSAAFVKAALIIAGIGKSFLLIVTPILAVIGLVALLVTRFNILREAGLSVTQSLKIFFIDAAKSINDVFFGIINTTINSINQLANAILAVTGIDYRVPLADFSGVSEQLAGLKAEILESVNVTEDDLPGTIETLKGNISTIFSSLKNEVSGAFTTIPELANVAVTETKKIGDGIDEVKEKTDQLGNQIENSFASGLSSAVTQFAEGTKTADEAFKDFSKNFLSRISEMILQSIILNAIQGALSPVSASSTGSSVPAPKPFAEGGLVSGPGSSTSDSIVARLSNGEFVNDAKTVSFFGPGFFANLKRMARGGFTPPSPKNMGVPGFAEGGLVSSSDFSPGQSLQNMKIEIKNSGEGKQVRSATTEQDAQGAVVSIILEDISKNGNISKGFQSSFGLKRSGI